MIGLQYKWVSWVGTCLTHLLYWLKYPCDRMCFSVRAYFTQGTLPIHIGLFLFWTCHRTFHLYWLTHNWNCLPSPLQDLDGSVSEAVLNEFISCIQSLHRQLCNELLEYRSMSSHCQCLTDFTIQQYQIKMLEFSAIMQVLSRKITTVNDHYLVMPHFSTDMHWARTVCKGTVYCPWVCIHVESVCVYVRWSGQGGPFW